MKKIRKIIFIILPVILILLLIIAAWQWNNIRAFLTSRYYSTEELSAQIIENEQNMEAAFLKESGLFLRDLSEEEKQQLYAGAISEAEALALITEQTSSAGQQAASADQTAPTAENNLGELLARVYVLQAYYTSSLADLEAAAAAQYNALPNSEKNIAAKKEIALNYAQIAGDLEKECDAKMSALLEKIKKAIVDKGADLTLIDDIRTAYAEEKRLKKAYYLSLIE